MSARAVLVVLALVTAGCATSTPVASPEPEPETQSEVVEEESAETLSETVEQDASGEEAQDDDEASVQFEADSEPFSDLCNASEAVIGSRPDVTSSGNRIGLGSIDFTTLDEVVIELPDDAIWVTSDPAVTGGWFVVLSRGSTVRVSPDGVVTTALDAGVDLPPELDETGAANSPFRFHDLFIEPLEDGRVVMAESIAAALVGPTGSYAHGVLGDALEASGVAWVDTCTGETGRIDMAEPDVIEGISPILYDVDTDGELEIVVTLANGNEGARLAAFELNGTLVGDSEPIGQGRRWRNQLAVGPFGPEGQIELISVRTPHIGGTVEAFRLVPGEADEDSSADPTGAFIPVAESDPNFTSHVIGARNLSLAIAIDATGDSIPDVVVPSANRETVFALTRTDVLDGDRQGWNVVGERALDNELTGNIATQELSPGAAALAIPDGDLLRIWR